MVHDERMTSPPRAADRGRLTAAAVVAAVVLAVVGSAAGTAYDQPGTAVFADTLSFALAVAVVAVVGAIITLAVPGNRVGWLMLAAAAVLGIGTAFTEAGIHGVVTVPGSVPGAAYLAALGPGLQAAGLVIAVVGVPPVPDGRLGGGAGCLVRRRRAACCNVEPCLRTGWLTGTARSAWQAATHPSQARSALRGFCLRWARPPVPSPGSSSSGGAVARCSGSSCCCWPWPPGRPRWSFSPY